MKKGWTNPIPGISSPSVGYVRVDLAFADSEHLGAAHWAFALGRRLAVFHGYGLGVLYLSFSAALYAISLHVITSLVIIVLRD